MTKKTSDAQLRANRKWEDKNREKTRVDGYRRTARLFIRTHASIEDLEELEGLIAEKRKALQEEK